MSRSRASASARSTIRGTSSTTTISRGGCRPSPRTVRRASPFRRPALPASTSSKCCMASSPSRTATRSRIRRRDGRASNSRSRSPTVRRCCRRRRSSRPRRNVRSLPPQGELVATPQFAGVGEPVVVHGAGLEPGKNYQLNWTRVVGNRMTGRGWEEVSKVIAEAKADTAGTRRIPLQHARRSRRHPRAVDPGRTGKEDRIVMDQAHRAARSM